MGLCYTHPQIFIIYHIRREWFNWITNCYRNHYCESDGIGLNIIRSRYFTAADMRTSVEL